MESRLKAFWKPWTWVISSPPRAVILVFLSLLFLLNTSSASASEDTDFEPGWTIAGFPLLNYASGVGFGYGGILFAIDKGDTPLEDEPYLTSIGGQFYQTTGGYAFHKVLLDMRDVLGSGTQFTFFGGYESWETTPYFGESGRSRRFPDDHEGERQSYGDRSMWLVPRAFVPFPNTDWWLVAGATVRHVWVSGKEGSVLKSEEPRGSDGGTFVQWLMGGRYTTLERSVSPRYGTEVEGTFRAGPPFLGSTWNAFGANGLIRQAFSLTDSEELVFAWMATLDLQDGEPFFQSHWLTGGQQTPFGGHTYLRGLPIGRLRGNIKAVSSAELRWQFWGHTAFSKPLDWFVAGFTDVGSASTWDEFSGPPLPWVSGGGGPRWLYDNVFLLRLDVAVAVERFVESGVGGESAYTKPIPGVYLAVGHPY